MGRGRERLFEPAYRAFLSATRFNSEVAHDFVSSSLGFLGESKLWKELTRKEFKVVDEEGRMKVNLFNERVQLDHPLGIAAGIVKKNIPTVRALEAFGPSSIEIGSLTLQPCKGNPRKRTVTLPNGKVIQGGRIIRDRERNSANNWMGLPGEGTKKAITELQQISPKPNIPVGINLAPTPGLAPEGQVEDLRASLVIAYSAEPSWITLNLTCPNVNHQTKKERSEIMENSRTLMLGFSQERERLVQIYGFNIPLLIKLSPDLEPAEIKQQVEACKEFGYDGIIAGNTTTDPILSGVDLSGFKEGGWSGAALWPHALRTAKLVRQYDPNRELSLIFCGGIMGAEQLIEAMEVADYCQVATGFALKGPYFFRRTLTDYLAYLEVKK